MRSGLLGLGLALLLLGGVRADTIYMKDTGLKIEGKILREEPDYIVVLVNDDSGQVRIPKKKIDRIEYDIATQLSSLKENDVAGRYKVAMWAIEKGMLNDAVKLLEELRDKENAPADLLKKLGAVYEQREQLDKALATFSDYLKGAPTDEEIKGKVAELAEKVKPKVDATTTPESAKKKEGLEATGTWVAENWAIPNKVSITTEATGNKVVVCQSEGGTQDKVAFARSGQILTFADNKELVFKVYSNVSMNIGLAFVNQKNEWFETRSNLRVNPNTWTKLSVNLKSKDFKTAPDWKHDQELKGIEAISRIIILPYTQRPFLLYLDDMFGN